MKKIGWFSSDVQREKQNTACTNWASNHGQRGTGDANGGMLARLYKAAKTNGPDDCWSGSRISVVSLHAVWGALVCVGKMHLSTSLAVNGQQSLVMNTSGSHWNMASSTTSSSEGRHLLLGLTLDPLSLSLVTKSEAARPPKSVLNKAQIASVVCAMGMLPNVLLKVLSRPMLGIAVCGSSLSIRLLVVMAGSLEQKTSKTAAMAKSVWPRL